MSDEEPSRVLHLRNVTAEVSHADLQNLAAPFGKVQNVVLLREKNQALIQMESAAAATAVLNFYTTGYTEVGGRRVYLKYSRHQELTGKAAAQGNGSILLVSMSNPMYDIRTTLQITADLLYQVFAPYGAVTKIVVIQKSTGENRQQALVQFDGHETAEQAKQYLQGQNVYVGTSVYFTLDIQYSNLEDLTVRTSSPTARVFAPPGQGGLQQIAAPAHRRPRSSSSSASTPKEASSRRPPSSNNSSNNSSCCSSSSSSSRFCNSRCSSSSSRGPSRGNRPTTSSSNSPSCSNR